MHLSGPHSSPLLPSSPLRSGLLPDPLQLLLHGLQHHTPPPLNQMLSLGQDLATWVHSLQQGLWLELKRSEKLEGKLHLYAH